MTQRDEEKILRHKAFLEMSDVDRPLIAFTVGTGEDPWSPWRYNKGAASLFGHGFLEPDDMDPKAFIEDQRHYLEITEAVGDDTWRTPMPFASMPWLEAIVGCPVERSEAALKGKPYMESPAEFDRIRFDPENPWVRKYIEFLDVYQEAFGDRYPVGQSVLRGPSDIASALLGSERGIQALMMQPDDMGKLLERITEVLEAFTRLQLEHIPMFHGGQVIGQYEIWAPGTFQRIQEDFVALYSPDLYRRFLKPMDERLSHLTDYTIFHLHTTAMFLMSDFVELDRIQIFQLSKDEGSATVEAMLPSLKSIQEAGRCLFVKGRFNDDDIALLKKNLRAKGLAIQPVVSSVEQAQEQLPKYFDWA